MGYFTKPLTGMSYLRKTCIDSDMTRQLKGTKVDFMKPGAIKPLGTVGPIPCLQSCQQPHQVSQECHFLAGYFGNLRKKNSPKSTGSAGMPDGKYVAWLLAWRGY